MIRDVGFFSNFALFLIYIQAANDMFDFNVHRMASLQKQKSNKSKHVMGQVLDLKKI